MDRRPGGSPLRVLMELRPAFAGNAGIPQETRILFRALQQLEGVEAEGLIQSSSEVLSKGLPPDECAAGRWSADRRIDRLSRVVVSQGASREAGLAGKVRAIALLAWKTLQSGVGSAIGVPAALTRFDPRHFEDFIWRSMFARTLGPDDFNAIASARYRVAQLPWYAMHALGSATASLGLPIYPRLDTKEFDVMIGETPYPARISPSTRMVIRYHDAIPLLFPHTISDRRYHRASHFHALRNNVANGAWFACVSEATRKDLLSVFPQASARAVTIYNMVSDAYFPEDSDPARVLDIIDARRVMEPAPPAGRGLVSTLLDAASRFKRTDAAFAPLIAGADGQSRYLLMVSTIEPRKNHLALLSAWEQACAAGCEDLHLVLVGSLGWEHRAIMERIRPWIERGRLHFLEDVPPADLRCLYRHALLTVCPSLAEGFDFTGVEAMRSGGTVAASDIPVHREVFAEAADYFNPYSPAELASLIEKAYRGDDPGRREQLRDSGRSVGSRYCRERIIAGWADFLREVGQPVKAGD